jgi:xylose isomerase
MKAHLNTLHAQHETRHSHTPSHRHNNKNSRESTSPADLFYAHISGMDALARGLRSAAALLEAGELTALRDGRYASWREKGGVGARIADGKV